MKILFVNNFRKRGGGEEFLRDLLPGLVEKGASVGLVCRPGTPLTDMFRNSQISLFPIQRSGLRFVSAVWKMARVIRDNSYEFVNIQRGHDIIQAWLAVLLSGKRPLLLYTLQVPEFIQSRFLLSRMARIVTISRYIRNKLAAFYPTVAPRINIIHYGIELDRFRRGITRSGSLRNRFGLLPGTRIIGAVGDLWKNQIEFLDALVLIRQELPGTCFALAASERGVTQIEAFKQRAEQLGLADAVLWTGRLSKEDMPSFYADIDVAVSTYPNEGFGIWVLEALAAGTPVVSVNAGGIRDSLEGCPAGVLVNGGPQDMAAAVVRILKDASSRAMMADAGPRWIAERFSRKRMVDDYLEFFRSLMVSEGVPRRQSVGNT
jgi:glycosyltransferase involved in cell wall biosynthesis